MSVVLRLRTRSASMLLEPKQTNLRPTSLSRLVLAEALEQRVDVWLDDIPAR